MGNGGVQARGGVPRRLQPMLAGCLDCNDSLNWLASSAIGDSTYRLRQPSQARPVDSKGSTHFWYRSMPRIAHLPVCLNLRLRDPLADSTCS